MHDYWVLGPLGIYLRCLGSQRKNWISPNPRVFTKFAYGGRNVYGIQRLLVLEPFYLSRFLQLFDSEPQHPAVDAKGQTNNRGKEPQRVHVATQ